MSPNSINSPRPVSSIDAKSIRIGSDTPATKNSKLPTSTSPEAQERSPVVQHPANAAGERLLGALWRSPDLFHQIGFMDRQSNRFKNLPVDGVANAMAKAQKLSSVGLDVYFACAEYLTPDNRKAVNAAGACAFWLDIDCGEDKAAAGKGYASVEDAKKALFEVCEDAGLPKPTFIVHSGGGLHVYWALDGMISRVEWPAYARKFKDLTKALRLLADDSRTADIASVLRVPDTSNHKNSPPRPVTQEYA